MKIAVVGYGFVGKQVYRLFSKHELVIYDPPLGYEDKDAVNKCDLAVVCVPTPSQSKENDSCDISAVEEVVSWITCPILIKSAVIPGTTDMLVKKYNKLIVVSPEYAGESKYDNTFEYFHKEMIHTPWIVLGGTDKAVDYVYNIMLSIVGPEKKWYFLTAKEAETVKYFENTFFAFKVSIVNEFYDICQTMGVDWKKVREAWLADPRLSPMHTAVFINERGYDGKCFPKDTKALLAKCKEMGFEPPLLNAMVLGNNKHRKPLRLS
jgi:UDPglucose 6-dehydrogenase